MSATFFWACEWFQTTPSSANPSEAVLQIGWRCNGEEVHDGKVYTASVYSTCSLPPANPEDFTPFPDLQREQCLNWVWENGVNKDATEAAVAQQLANQISPPTQILPPPWNA